MSSIYNVQTLICKLTPCFIKAAVNKPSAFRFLEVEVVAKKVLHQKSPQDCF